MVMALASSRSCHPASSGEREVPGGCEHYTRGCLLRAPCCGKFYTCRLCHDGKETHVMDRFKVTQVQCVSCKCIQKAQQTCESCSNVFGEYYCNVCHLYDKEKKQYHCEGCGICRIGPKEEFVHCTKCNLCLPMHLRGNHKCIENVSRQDCPICLEDMHTSRVSARVLPCGHLLHSTCYENMFKQCSFLLTYVLIEGWPSFSLPGHPNLISTETEPRSV
ncbi:RING finger and CHY zinc finger domain-containing protein 1 isoform X4 [Ascaphus truei]|uniref:RING finger and CHY zinc finger domain-containing protein 1 isoform X4 n=1 Tax=Ascaphus truei TaxID=8439 RepID=UPI003F59C9A6